MRRVTEVNAGRKTAGVDGEVVLTPEAKVDLADWVQHREPNRGRPGRSSGCISPRRSGKRRPLGIPVIADRALQARAANALEPEWEARFEPRSYGFRPGRGCHDAIEAIYQGAKGASPARGGYSTRTWQRRSTGSATITSSASSARSPPGN